MTFELDMWLVGLRLSTECCMLSGNVKSVTRKSNIIHDLVWLELLLWMNSSYGDSHSSNVY